LIPYPLLPPAVRACAQRRAPPSHRRDMLAEAAVEAFDERRSALPATGRPPLRNRRPRAAYAPLVPPSPAPPAYRLEPLGLEPRWPGHPGGRGRGPGGLPTGARHPLALGRAPGGPVCLEAVAQTQGDAVRGQPLAHLMAHTLGQGHAAFPDVHRQPHFARESERRRPQAVPHGVGSDRAPPRGAAHAQARCAATAAVHDAVDRDALAMDQGAVRRWNVLFTSRTVAVPPRAPAGRAVGAQVAQPPPAPR